MLRTGERRSDSGWEPSRGMLSPAPPGYAGWRQAFRMQGDRELPRRAVQRFEGRVFGRSHQAFHRALPVAIRPMPFRKGEHELPGFVEGFNLPAVGEEEINSQGA